VYLTRKLKANGDPVESLLSFCTASSNSNPAEAFTFQTTRAYAAYEATMASRFRKGRQSAAGSVGIPPISQLLGTSDDNGPRLGQAMPDPSAPVPSSQDSDDPAGSAAARRVGVMAESPVQPTLARHASSGGEARVFGEDDDRLRRAEERVAAARRKAQAAAERLRRVEAEAAQQQRDMEQAARRRSQQRLVETQEFETAHGAAERRGDAEVVEAGQHADEAQRRAGGPEEPTAESEQTMAKISDLLVGVALLVSEDQDCSPARDDSPDDADLRYSSTLC